MEIAIWHYALVFSRFALITVFVVSFIGKLRDVPFFQKTISNFQILPDQMIKPVSFLLITGEVAITIMLLVGNNLLLIGYRLAILLLIIFTVALFYALGRGIQTPCGCFGSSVYSVSEFDIWRNTGLLFVAIAGLLSVSKLAGTQIQGGSLELGLIAIISVVLTLLWVNFSALLQLIQL